MFGCRMNSSELLDVPPHRLEVKVEMSFMFLMNTDCPTLYDGTRLFVKRLLSHIIDANILIKAGKIINFQNSDNFKRLALNSNKLRVMFSFAIRNKENHSKS